MGFLAKVEAAVIKPTKATKPVTFNGKKKPVKPAKPEGNMKPDKFEKSKSFLKKAKEKEATAEKQHIKQTNFMRLKQLVPELEEILKVANPFDLNDKSWSRFFALAAPKIVTSYLWDLGHIDRTQRANMIKLFKQRVKLP